ncbi:hypothetical protein DOY81_009971, partial [Sarcophaga bullata]
ITVTANRLNQRPFLQIESPSITRLIITHPHRPHYLQCKANIVESFYQNETNYFYTWFFNENVLKLKKQNYYVLFRNGTLRLPPDEKISGSYRCKINANTTAVISESITVEYPVLKRRPADINLTALCFPLPYSQCLVWPPCQYNLVLWKCIVYRKIQ